MAAVLNLGNITFKTCSSNVDGFYIPAESQKILNNVAVLLGMNKAELEDILTNRTFSVADTKIR